MGQEEVLYGFGSIVIAGVLFALMMLGNQLGFYLGRWVQGYTDTEVKSLTGSIQASILGLLALLLGFTFSMSMQRFDHRSMALIDEANAIGTTLLRTQLLPGEIRTEVVSLMDEYLDTRLAVSQLDLTREDERATFHQRANAIQQALWGLAVRAANDDPRVVTSGAFINALNAMIDSQGKRNALLQMHVPEPVLLLLFVVFIASGGILGYSGGLTGKRVATPMLLVSALITLIVFIIIDLDRPKRGLIQVNQAALLQLKQP